MKDGFVKVACASPLCRVADVTFNVEEVIKTVALAVSGGAKVLVLPELCLTSYSSEDLFFQDVLISAAEKGLQKIVDYSKGLKILLFVGLPVKCDALVYNACAVVFDGKILGVVPKTYLPNYNEFYEKRTFAAAEKGVRDFVLCGQKVPFGTKILFRSREMPSFVVAAEICEDIWVSVPPSCGHTAAGATLVVNLSASDEFVTKSDYRRDLVKMQSAKCLCAYCYSSCGEGESTTDLVFAAHRVIAENGKVLAESQLFQDGLTYADVDFQRISAERSRRHNGCFAFNPDYVDVFFDMPMEETRLEREFSPFPFIPKDKDVLKKRAEVILSLQSHALAQRLKHVNAKCALVGVSGGLDSALALLVAVRAKQLLDDEQKKNFTVWGITMPCFGTTERTLKNAKTLTRLLGATTQKISIRTAVNRHLLDIKQKEGVFDVAFENAQARERTQVLMDLANSRSGLVVGTGDLSEIALGWSTFNGDHMSMFNVNASVPKTLVRYLVAYEGERMGGAVKNVLADILDTPISPELLPADGKEMAQKTEDKIGPYCLHDFFLFHFVRHCYSPSKILRLAERAFDGLYDKATIKKWEKLFFTRFFAQQFKRSCSPDGVKVGSVCLSPRGDWRMPSDAVAAVWLDDLENS